MVEVITSILSLTKLLLMTLMVFLYVKYYISRIRKKGSCESEIIKSDNKKDKK